MKTIDLKGNNYATVATRIKEFREACPNGLIKTKPEIQSDGQIIFNARILKDKSKPDSGEATGHSLGKAKGDKDFEKLETIAIGRALAILGYMSSGEVASSEEMEEFHKYRQEKKSELMGDMAKCKTIDELKDFFLGLGPLMADPDMIRLKDELKLTLQNANN